MGESTVATGPRSIAIGIFTSASGDYSTAMGNFTNASGTSSTAMGSLTIASGSNSTAMGFSTDAIGSSSTAMGNSTFAFGVNSIALGLGTYASANTSVALGRYNDSIIGSSRTNWVDTDPVFIIGNGTEHSNRNNALVVYKNGNTLLNGELVRASTGAANNLLPICYGSVLSSGAINSGTSNFSVVNSATGQFDITIDNETYITSAYVTNVTVLSNFPRFVSITSSAGKLVVRVWDAASNPIDLGFHFVVYKQ
jgi:hypothetical protein